MTNQYKKTDNNNQIRGTKDKIIWQTHTHELRQATHELRQAKG